MLETVLVAAGGEPGAALVRACQALGRKAVAAHSNEDAGGPHVLAADEPVLLGDPSGYADARRVVEAARQSRAQAVHPGDGPLAADPGAARAVLAAGLAWVGPPPDALERLADLPAVAAAAELPLAAGPAVERVVVLLAPGEAPQVLGEAGPRSAAAAVRVAQAVAGGGPLLLAVGLADGPALAGAGGPVDAALLEPALRLAAVERAGARA